MCNLLVAPNTGYRYIVRVNCASMFVSPWRMQQCLPYCTERSQLIPAQLHFFRAVNPQNARSSCASKATKYTHTHTYIYLRTYTYLYMYVYFICKSNDSGRNIHSYAFIRFILNAQIQWYFVAGLMLVQHFVFLFFFFSSSLAALLARSRKYCNIFILYLLLQYCIGLSKNNKLH